MAFEDDCPQIIVTSFGFLHGVPEAPIGALLVDLRTNLRNPADDKQLVQMTGLDDPVIDHVLSTAGCFEVIARTVNQAEALYAENRKKNFMARVLIGCQGGRHRSVVVAAAVGQTLLSHGYSIEVEHLHIARPVVTKPPQTS